MKYSIDQFTVVTTSLEDGRFSIVITDTKTKEIFIEKTTRKTMPSVLIYASKIREKMVEELNSRDMGWMNLEDERILKSLDVRKMKMQ